MSGADPGFPRRRGPKPSRRGAPAYKFARFSEKLHGIKKILVRGGGGRGALDPPLDVFIEFDDKNYSQNDSI